MSRHEAQDWDLRYTNKPDQHTEPHRFLLDVLHYLPRSGLGLDVAMGRGQNANVLSQRGLKMIGVDFSMVALRYARKHYPNLAVAKVDLPRLHLQPRSVDVILNFWFLDREMFPIYEMILKPGGFLVLETMQFDPDVDQSHLRLEYLLQPEEILQTFSGWNILLYDDKGREIVKGISQPVVRLLAQMK
jgi:tellurite methyltransferase